MSSANTTTQIHEIITELLKEPASACPYFESRIKVIADKLNTIDATVDDLSILKGLKRGLGLPPIKRYKTFIKEMWLNPDQAVGLSSNDMKTAQPAVMHKKTKEVIIGKRGELHFELPERSKKTPKSEPSDWHRGFWHEKRAFVNDPKHEIGDAADFVRKKTGRSPSEAKITKAKIWNSKRKMA